MFEIDDELPHKNLAFDDEQHLDFLLVKYSNDPLKIFNVDTLNLNDLSTEILRTKSERWLYEHEVRLICDKQGPIKFKRKQLKSIIFGAKSTPKDRYTVCKLLGSLLYKADLQIARLQHDQHELVIESMTMEDIAGSGVYIEEFNFGS